ncbi:MAG TPA: TatD family hydrolase [Candidatus Deferrimicrobium sp.]|nr:TatD family hydrolase [Candidatus Deferrimicrobium sp.]
MRLIDSHCHLQADRFDDDVDAVVAAARAAGVERILVPGWNAWSSAAAVALVERFGWLDAAVGVHPHDAARVDDEAWSAIAASATDPRVIAIGETGLDYDRVFSPVLAQLANLRRNLVLAAETGKPAILHCRSGAGERDAQDALLGELRALGGDAPRVVIHSFSGPPDYAEAMLELGAVISISGLAFRKGEEATTDVVRLVPADRLLVETDSPFLAPPGAPRGRNAPEWVRLTAAWVAELRGDEVETAGDALVAAYDDVFRSAAVEPGTRG